MPAHRVGLRPPAPAPRARWEYDLPHAQTHATVLGAPRALGDYGFTEDDIPAAVEAILPVVPASNPARVTAENMTALLDAAREGSDPA